MKKRILSILLALCMVLCLVPTAAFADGTPTGTALTQSSISRYFSSKYGIAWYDLKNDTYHLSEDVTLTAELRIDGTVTLDLNGHVLDLNGNSIYMRERSELILHDSDPGAVHKFDKTNAPWTPAEDDAAGKSIVEVRGGIITGGKGNEDGAEMLGGGVYVNDNSTFIMNGGSIVGCSADHGGGIVGESSGGTYIENCTNVCTVAGSSSYIGGIAGALFSNTDPNGIRNCTNFGSISGSSQVGGIIGTLIGISGTSEIIGCRNTGNVSAKKSRLGSASAGGIAGYIVRSKVTDCHNEGDVSAVNTGESGNDEAGGIASNIMDADEIVNCVNTGNVSGSGEQHTYIGGIAGNLNGKINKVNCCYNTGKVSGAGDRTRIGGIIGYLSSESTKVYCCYNMGGQLAVPAINLTT